MLFQWQSYINRSIIHLIIMLPVVLMRSCEQTRKAVAAWLSLSYELKGLVSILSILVCSVHRTLKYICLLRPILYHKKNATNYLDIKSVLCLSITIEQVTVCHVTQRMQEDHWWDDRVELVLRKCGLVWFVCEFVIWWHNLILNTLFWSDRFYKRFVEFGVCVHVFVSCQQLTKISSPQMHFWETVL